MAKERALTLEALRVMDAIDRRGSFAAAADELGRVPSALSYTMQKLEEELDVVLFDRSGHRTKYLGRPHRKRVPSGTDSNHHLDINHLGNR